MRTLGPLEPEPPSRKAFPLTQRLPEAQVTEDAAPLLTHLSAQGLEHPGSCQNKGVHLFLKTLTPFLLACVQNFLLGEESFDFLSSVQNRNSSSFLKFAFSFLST